MYDISKKILRKYSHIYKWYFVNIFLEMSYITLYLANSWQFLVPVPGCWDLTSNSYLKSDELGISDHWDSDIIGSRFFKIDPSL